MLFLRINFVILTLLVVEHFCVLQLNFERSEIEFCNETYFKNFKLAIRKHSRGAKKTLNMSGKILKTLGTNVSIKISVQEYLHNEYKPTFIHFEFKWCELLESPFMRLKERFGLPCPTPPMDYNLSNITISTETLPESFPLAEGRLHSRMFIRQSPIKIAASYLYAKFIKVKHYNVFDSPNY